MGSGVSLKEQSESENINGLMTKRRSSLPSTIQMNGNKELRLKRIFHVNKTYMPDEDDQKFKAPPTAASLPPPPPPPIQTLIQTKPQTVTLFAPVLTPVKNTLPSETRPRTMMTQILTPVPRTAIITNNPVSTQNVIHVEPAPAPRIVLPVAIQPPKSQQLQQQVLKVNPVVLVKKPTPTAQIITNRNISTQPRTMLITPINQSQLYQTNKPNQIKIITKT